MKDENEDFNLEEELEKTKVLDELGNITSQLETEEEHLEALSEEIALVEEQEEIKQPEKEKKSLKEKWQAWPKKFKVMLISGIVLFLIAIGVFVFFLVRNNDKPSEEDPVKKPESPVVIEDNYKYQDGVLTFLNEKKEEIGTYECKNKEETLCMVANLTMEDEFDVPKQLYEDLSPVLKRSQIYFDTYVFLYDNKKESDSFFILYNIKEQKEEGIFQAIKTYSSSPNYFVLKNNEGMYGLLEMKETGLSKVIDYKYDYMGIVDSESTKDSIVVKEKNMWYLVTTKNKKITKAIDKEIRGFSEMYLKAVDTKGNYYVIDYDNKVVSESANYIDLFDSVYVSIRDQKLYVTDYEGHKMNEEGIKISETKMDGYTPIKIYKEDGSYDKTLQKYSVTDSLKENGLLTFDVDGTYTAVNIYEGTASRKYKYLNYFDGKLYFYQDEAKKHLIGSYTCKNKNVMKGKDDAFRNCIVASEDLSDIDNETLLNSEKIVSMMPMYHGRFVFIMDVPTLVSADTNQVILYDLKDKKSLSTYNQVFGYLKNGATDMGQNTEATSYIIARNKSNQYGAIKITSSGISSVVKFSYKYLTFMNGKFIAEDNDGSYVIDLSGNKLTSALKGEIRNFNENYLSVLEDGKYYVKTFGNANVSNTGYHYISLHSSFFAGIDDKNELGIYGYNATGNNMIRDLIPLKKDNYYGNANNAFKIDVSGNTIHISVLDSEVYTPYAYNLQTGEKQE